MTVEAKLTEHIVVADRINHFKTLRDKRFLRSLNLQLDEIINTDDLKPDFKTVHLKLVGQSSDVLKLRIYTKSPNENLVEIVVYESFNNLSEVAQQASLGIAASYCNPLKNPVVVPFSEVFSNEKIQIIGFFNQMYLLGSKTYENAWKIASNFQFALGSHNASESH